MKFPRLVFSAALLAWPLAAAPSLPSLFGDHMMVQRGRPVPVWGWADPGEKISVTLGAATAATVAAPDGRWRVDLPAQQPGGPLTLTVAGKTTLRFRDVLAGEVWVASGQSNMAFPMSRAVTAAEDLPAAADAEIRLFTVPRASALQPLDRFPGAWQLASPESARDFSAVAYYFARELHRRLGVPVGIIHNSWSGSIADEWTDPASLKSDPDFAPILERWRAALPQASGYVEKPFEFDLEFDRFEFVPRPGAAQPPALLAGFPNGKFRSELGAAWSYTWDSAPQTGFEIAPGGSTARLSGRLFTTDTALLRFSSAAPADLGAYSALRFRHRGSGAFRLALLAGERRYTAPVIQPRAEWTEAVLPFDTLRSFGAGGRQPFAPRAVTGLAIEPGSGRDAERVPSGLYHAMLCPLVPYGIRGVVWYQGEGNSGRAFQYRKLLPAMIRGWRQAWGQGDFPFVIVQLPYYRQRPVNPSGGGWAELREAQLMTFRNVPKTGLVVTIDTGDAGDPHPRDKRPVGTRVALWAEGDVYGKGGIYSGPLFDSASIEGAGVRVRFHHTGTGLTGLDGGALRGFAIAGEDRKFVWAGASVEGETVVVSSPQIPKPVAVRYAWSDNPDCNLGNREGLPASPFRTDDWPGLTFAAR